MYLNNYYDSHLCTTIAGINIGCQLTHRLTNQDSYIQPFIQCVWNATDGHGFPLHLSWLAGHLITISSLYFNL